MEDAIVYMAGALAHAVGAIVHKIYSGTVAYTKLHSLVAFKFTRDTVVLQ